MKVVNQVMETNDYSLFKKLDGNRIVNKLHVKRLLQSFIVNYLMCPIIVNQLYEIIDGQHRFEAAKKAGLPINFIMVQDYGLKEVQMLNENMKNWGKGDYLHAYCDLGYPNYLKMRDFMQRFPEFSLNVCEIFVTDKAGRSGSSKISKDLITETNKKGVYKVEIFKNGNLEIPDYDQAIENAEKVLRVKEHFDAFGRDIFVRAMVGIFKIEGYDHSRFLKKLKSNPMQMVDCTNITQFKIMIEKVYNYKCGLANKMSLQY